MRDALPVHVHLFLCLGLKLRCKLNRVKSFCLQLQSDNIHVQIIPAHDRLLRLLSASKNLWYLNNHPMLKMCQLSFHLWFVFQLKYLLCLCVIYHYFQDFGPQVNFKKKKLKLDNFTGLPEFSKVLVERMWIQVPALSDFQPVELCNLDYIPERGSSIDPHFDDFWVWGERLVTLNLLSDTILTFSNDEHYMEVAVPMPSRSLIIVEGAARYKWKHAIKRQHIVSRRIAITLRELSQEFCEGGKSFSLGTELIQRALTFQGKSVQVNIKDCEC